MLAEAALGVTGTPDRRDGVTYSGMVIEGIVIYIIIDMITLVIEGTFLPEELG